MARSWNSFFLFGILLLPLFQKALAQRPRLNGMGNYAQNRPGVVMIRTIYTADVYVNSMKMDGHAFNMLLDSIQRLDHGGGVSPEQKLDIVLQEMDNNPSRYFQTTFDYIKQPEQITATGTGFFLTADGYVATNCHLIERDNAFIRRQFMLTAFQSITDASIAALENSWATVFTEQQRSLLYNTYASVYSRLFSMVLHGLKKDIYVVYRSDKETGAPASLKKPATIVVKGQPMPGKDIAILKIETDKKEMPVLPLAQPTLPKVGGQLFVYGYPGPVTNNDFLAAESAIEPTLTTGIISAVKKSIYGWPIIQMDANINHGSSGGPVCNEEGEVVGLTTFGSIENTGGLAAGLNFAIPVVILDEYLDSAGVTARPGTATHLFDEGLSFFDHGHFRSALNRFNAVRKLNDGYPGIYTYMSECRYNIDNGFNHDSGPVENMIFYVSALLALFVLIAALALRRPATSSPS